MATVEQFARRYLRVKDGPNDAGWITCFCPFHAGGSERKPSFGININSGVWNCFVCGSGTFASLRNTLGVASPEWANVVPASEAPVTSNESTPYVPECILRRFSPAGQYLPMFKPLTLSLFEVGYDPVTERVSWPIRDITGRLIAISGRATTKEAEEKYGKYKLYTTEIQDIEPGYVSHPRVTLYAVDKIYPRLMSPGGITLVLVEGFKACAWVFETGIYVAGLLSANITRGQVAQLMRFNLQRVILFLDNNEAGIKGTERVGQKLFAHFPTFVARYPEGTQQPDDISQGLLPDIINSPIPFMEWSMLTQRSMFSTPRERKEFFLTKLYLSKDGVQDRIRILDANYNQEAYDASTNNIVMRNAPYLWTKEHYFPKVRNYFGCSSGADGTKPCIGCQLSRQYDLDDEGKKVWRVNMARDVYSFCIIHLAWFHPTEKQSKAGRPYPTFEKCTAGPAGNMRCDYCNMGIPKRWGLKRIWGLNSKQFDTLGLKNDELKQHCHCGGQTAVTGFCCPECGAELQSVRNLTEPQVILYRKTVQKCPVCETVNSPTEVFACDSCATPRPQTIFDVDLVVYSDKDSRLNFGQISDPSPIPYAPNNAEGWMERWEEMKEQADLATILTPPTIEQQSKIYGVDANDYDNQ